MTFDQKCEELILLFLDEHPNATPSDLDEGFGFPNGALEMIISLKVPSFNRSPFGLALGRLVKDGRVLATDENSCWRYALKKVSCATVTAR
jgi:hypothetical protein